MVHSGRRDGAYEQVRNRGKPAHGPSGFLPEGQDGTSWREQTPRTHTCGGFTEGGRRLGLTNMQLCIGDGGRRDEGIPGGRQSPSKGMGLECGRRTQGETPVRDPSGLESSTPVSTLPAKCSSETLPGTTLPQGTMTSQGSWWPQSWAQSEGSGLPVQCSSHSPLPKLPLICHPTYQPRP